LVCAGDFSIDALKKEAESLMIPGEKWPDYIGAQILRFKEEELKLERKEAEKQLELERKEAEKQLELERKEVEKQLERKEAEKQLELEEYQNEHHQGWIIVETQDANPKARIGAVPLRLLGKDAAIL